MPIIGPLDPFRALGAARSAAGRVVRATRPDHLTLNERSLRTYSVMTHAFLHAAVAPSRRIRLGSLDGFGEHAAALATGLGLPALPRIADANNQRFAVEDDEGSQTQSLLVTRSGVLEMLWALEQLPTDDGAWALRALDACSQLVRFIELVRGDAYGRLLGSGWRRLFHGHVDWTLGVTVTTVSDGGVRGWRDIIVVGPQPDRASHHPYGFMQPYGYGFERLCGVKRTLDAEPIVRVMLDEWLRANGYLRTAPAVERTVSAAMNTSAAASET